MLFPNNSLRNLLVFSCILSLFYNCSKDDIDNEITDENGIITNPLPNPDPAQNSEKAAAIALYNTYYVASKTASTDPKWNGDVASCMVGNAPKEVRDKILMRIHYFRKATGLHNTLTENSAKSTQAMQAALMMHANASKGLSHNPDTNWTCYTEDGANGAASSLLTTAENAEAIDSYMRDNGTNNGPVGHRRWLYLPKLEEVGIGNTSSYNAIYVLGSSGSTLPDGAPEFISWPPKGYIPVKFAYDRWSFSYPKANFDNTKINLKDTSGNAVPLTVLPIVNGFGDNTIVWEPDGIQTTITTDTRYTVTLENVIIDNEARTFNYDIIFFTID